MNDLKMIYSFLCSLWKFIARHHGVELTDAVCEKIRAEEEAIVGKCGEEPLLVRILASRIMVCVLSYLYREDKRRRKYFDRGAAGSIPGGGRRIL